MDDLFDTFSKPAPASKAAAEGSQKLAGSKRDAEQAVNEETSNNNTSANGNTKHKKAKLSVPEDPQEKVVPIVADSFSTEASREVQASQGLGGAASTEQGGQLSLSHSVRHQVALPPNYDYVPINQHKAPEKPAREYKFTLDPFQQVSVASIQRNESVLVSAHTSAGKTVVAEYAIAQCLENKQRVIYTSPIKALSNQKYREMLADFGDVGLMTGDVTINPSASCLVMTTEILRSMLYRGSEIMREVAWVIFDEIHYMRDKERGVVWEETIILLPHTVRYVFLSATIPNAMEFAEWICKTHDQPVHVVYTDFRPTPLQHYLFPSGGDGIHLVVDERGNFRDDNFTKAMGSLMDAKGEDPANPKSGGGKQKGKTKKGGTKGPSDIYKIVKMIMVKNYSPVIVFAFSKRECENLAVQMAKLEFNTEEEKDMVEQVFTNAISGLSEDDRALPQIEQILPLLKRGIGIHHGGLLPILKEVIEILFQEGLIKCLCATETFSIGLNMPAKTVVFANVRKFDGKDFRTLSGGEYIQMSGRAGRRGLDDRGIVVMMVDEKLEPASAKGMVKGETDRLDSAFHLGYNMILNLMRVEGISPEFMLERCFYQFQNSASVPQYEKDLRAVEEERAAMSIPQEDKIADYYNLRQQLDIFNKDLHDVLCHPTYALPFLQPGRLVHVKHDEQDWGWGVVVNYNKRMGVKGRPLPEDEPPQNTYIVDVLLHVDVTTTQKGAKKNQMLTSSSSLQPCPPDGKGEFQVVPVLLGLIQGISHIRIFLPKDLKPIEPREQAFKHVQEVKRRFKNAIALLDPIEHMSIHDEQFKKLVKKIETLENRLAQNPLVSSPELPELYEQYSLKVSLGTKTKEIKKKISSAHSVMHLEELKYRKRALRRLGFCTNDDVVEMKGRVACEISTGDELLLTEMVFNGVFNDLTSEQCAALLSCFVFDEKSETTTRSKKELEVPLRSMQESARRIAKICQECKLKIDETEYVASFKTELMDAVYQWCKGAKFSEICKMSDVFEGSLIRAFRRLQELIRQMAMAAKAIGNTELEDKFLNSLECLERPSSVVFNPSLYL